MRNTHVRGGLGLPVIGAVLALSAVGFLTGRTSEANAAPAPPQAHATAQSINLALASGALTLEASPNGGTKADNDGTGSAAQVTNTPAVSLLTGQSLLTAGALSETAQAGIDGSSYACAGVLSPGGTVLVGSQGQTCTAAGNGTGGVQIDLNQLPGGIGGLLSPIANVTLEADAIIAHAHQVAPASASGDATIANLRVHVALVGGLLNQTVPVNVPAGPNADVLPAVVDALTGTNNPLLGPLVQTLTNAVSPAVSIKANYQNTQDGVLTVSGLHVSLLNNALATADVAKVTVGPNLPTADTGGTDPGGTDPGTTPTTPTTPTSPTTPAPAQPTAPLRVSPLSLTKTANRTSVLNGGTVVFRLTVRNRGKVVARNVTVCDRIPARTSVIRSTGGRLTRGQLCFARIAQLAPGRQRVYTVTLRVDRFARQPIVNVATAAADGVRLVTATRRVKVVYRPKTLQVPVTG